MSEKKANRQIDQHIIENASRKPAWRYSVLLIGFVAFFAFGILLYLTVEEVLPPSKNQIATPENREALLLHRFRRFLRTRRERITSFCFSAAPAAPDRPASAGSPEETR